MKKKINWILHYVTNGVGCDICGKVENGFPEFICDAHTHGMTEYDHLEFQVVLNYGAEEVGRLLNTMGCRVRDGERFQDGDLVEGLYLDCNILLKLMPDANGEPVLRLIIPDRDNRMPEDSVAPYTFQLLATPVLYIDANHRSQEIQDENN